MKKICMLGLGYIGLPTATMFANSGFEVIGVDVNQHIIDTLMRGEIHIYEPGLSELVTEAIGNGNLKVSLQPERADVFMIAVPTPFREELASFQNRIEFKQADMRYVVSAAEMILPYLQPGNLVILESTSPPNTTRDIVKPILEQSGLKAGEDFYLAYSPERVLPGKILHELVNNDRVVGGINLKSGELARKLYQSFVKGKILLTNSVTAEMVKLMENTYRDVNIALANEFSRLAERLGFNIWEAIELANHHPRVNVLRPGPGVGGHCISVDPWFLVETAPDITSLIHTSRDVNDTQPEFIVKLTKQILGNTDNKKIAVLGLAYKADVDDFRESPAVDVVEALLNDGIEVCAYDPFIHDKNAHYLTNSLNQATENADLLLILVAHSAFKQLSTSDIFGLRKDLIFDVCNCLDHNQWRKAGFEVHILGDRKE